MKKILNAIKTVAVSAIFAMFEVATAFGILICIVCLIEILLKLFR